jgi:predicted ABC-type sugar transport system permease subunit
VRGFAAFWWDFVVGDDWRLAAGVVLALAATAALSRTDVPSWWLLPVAVAGLLGTSLRRAVREDLDRRRQARTDL